MSTPVSNRYETQSVAVSEDELILIGALAKWAGIKPATAARQLLYRGLEEFLKDQNLKSSEFEEDIFERLKALILSDPRLTRAFEAASSEQETKREAKIRKTASANTGRAVQEVEQNALFSVGEDKPKTKRESRSIRKDIEDIKRDARERTRRKKAGGK